MSNNKKYQSEIKIAKLVYLAEINFRVCQKIYRDYSDNNNKNTFLILAANNAFCESVSVLHTLLCSTEKNDLKVLPVLEKVVENDKKTSVVIDSRIVNEFIQIIEKNYPCLDSSVWYSCKAFLIKPIESESYLGDIIANIRKQKRVESGLSDFQQLKNNFEKCNFHKIRHHQISHKHMNLKEPAGSTSFLLSNIHINNLEKIIKQLKINTYFWFDFDFINPYYSILNDLERCNRNM